MSWLVSSEKLLGIQSLNMEKIIYNKAGDKIALHTSIYSGAGSATKQTLNNEPYYILQHNLKNAQDLRKQGIPVRSPIHTQYNWPGRYTPLQHQKTTSAFFTLHRRGYCFNGLGSGKTLSALWAADYLLSIGEVKRVLVLSPLSTLKSVWWDSIFTHFPHLPPYILHGLTPNKLTQKRREIERAKILIVNHEYVKSTNSKHFLPTAALGVDLLIVDEGSMFRDATTDKYRGLRRFTDKCPHVWWMTATPTPNRPTDAWAQATAMDTCNMRFTEFRDLTMMKVRERVWVPRKNAEVYVRKILSPYIRFATEDCIDLPGITYETRSVEMTKEQAAAYKKLKEKAVLLLESGEVTAVNEAVKATKLLQIACSVVYDDEGKPIEIKDGKKIHELRSVVEEADGSPVIVFAPFKSVVAHIAAKLKDFRPVVITGDTPIPERNDAIQAFQEGKTRLLVAHPRTMSHGLTLTASSVLVWYAPVYSNDTYEQANGRIYRQGQSKHCTIIHLSSSPIEEQMYKLLKERGLMQGAVLRLLTERK